FRRMLFRSALDEALVDARGERAHVGVKVLVLVDGAPRGRRHLDEGELPDPARLELEEPLDSAEALEDPFRIVQAIDPDTELHLGRKPEALAHALPALRDRR